MFSKFHLVLNFVGVLICSVTSASAQTITGDAHKPLPQDSLWCYKIPYVVPTGLGENCLWDFSYLLSDDLERVPFDFSTRSYSDSLFIGLHRERCNYRLRFSSDTLWLNGYENSLLSLCYKQPVSAVCFPLEYNDSLGFAFSGVGRYCHQSQFSFMGTYAYEVLASGTVLLPDAMADSVLLLHTRLGYDVVDGTHVPVQTDTYLWYSPFCRYPLLESICIRQSESDSTCYATTFYYPQLLPQTKSLSQSPSVDSVSGADSLVSNVSFCPNPVHSVLRVNYSLGRSSAVYISLHHNGGPTTYQTPLTTEGEGPHSVSINVSNLPMGNYVVFIHADDVIVSGNVLKI